MNWEPEFQYNYTRTKGERFTYDVKIDVSEVEGLSGHFVTRTWIFRDGNYKGSGVNYGTVIVGSRTEAADHAFRHAQRDIELQVGMYE
ncbi:hypothetical protein D9X30_3441 [Cupriavidus sp. U2]|uniref:hypothetical protein n=1 Tax=Cupriavidus sp. U2 TaxID=2920269 RepID=UPI00129EF459|nr:hypothetical protein [Cupriavidus sp. U2]KAI3591616.1 hypothetical protein D9X30_3441 [Cupriavidus sp. U2]